jgi:hypothetical protein
MSLQPAVPRGLELLLRGRGDHTVAAGWTVHPMSLSLGMSVRPIRAALDRGEDFFTGRAVTPTASRAARPKPPAGVPPGSEPQRAGRRMTCMTSTAYKAASSVASFALLVLYALGDTLVVLALGRDAV